MTRTPSEQAERETVPITAGERRKALEVELSKKAGMDATPEDVVAIRKRAAAESRKR